MAASRSVAGNTKSAAAKTAAKSARAKPKPAARRKAAAGRKPAAKAAGAARSAARRSASSARSAAGSASNARRHTSQHEEALTGAVNAVRDLLTRGIVITGERLQETIDDTVSRGRMTRKDSEDLVQRLITTGRKQAEDFLKRLPR
ncbi:MAG TPA: hypothetical protein VLJ42_08480 [Solirubrobacteraceae bacterium]|nr:hypothetical protein [Solirubrobacteraceae bacterium]